MNISERLTQKSLKRILTNTYIKGQESENIKVEDLLEEIKQQVKTVVKGKENIGDFGNL
ncbi:hypothetical protein [Siminovitchia acidinfaciens]|uniref:hypothetical protein n=1 Tax=Siminovitchia acidinfaciens TaxID=2321395 RepID=UPI0013E032F8|nr:hypothetical protein [Siminovitchia acidinfaciens]